MLQFLKKLFGDRQQRELKQYEPIVAKINQQFATLASLSDEELKAKTDDFKARLREAVREIEEDIVEVKSKIQTTEDPEGRTPLYEELEKLEDEWLQTTERTLDGLVPEAFAVVKETCRRLVGKSWTAGGTTINWDMVPYDVQLIGGIAIHQGKISEMKTGEGKTLVAVAPLYLNALVGRGVHVVTVNPYLAQRDCEWMGPVFHFHGLTTDVLDRHEPHSPQRRAAYRADITYGTNNEFGFDYLRDNSFVFDADQLVQRNHHFAIVDEVDSVLIDEARTPLIISGPVPQANDNRFVELKPAIEKLVFAQQKLVAHLVGEAEKELKARDAAQAAGKNKEAREHEEAAGLALLRAHRGFPRNNKLRKIIQETGVAGLLQKTEFHYLQDNAKNMPLVDEELFFALDEKNHAIEMTDKGRELAARSTGDDVDLFVLPDVGEEVARYEAERAVAIESGKSVEEAQAAFEEKRRTLYSTYSERAERLHAIEQLLRAYTLYERDDEYIVQDGKVQIVDEHTGRVLSGRRYSDGLHQAIEAKEGVKVQAATQTYATITLQNYFRMYHKLAGMTGTAETESEEFFKIYELAVNVVPTNKPIARKDLNDIIYRTKREKYKAVIDRIKAIHATGQPILVGTASVEASETVSRMLQRDGIKHNVLNAKRDRAQAEAQIVAEAGQRGAVTIATNMAGRGTDIKLGPGVRELGGLAIIGTERHESRRIDLQLRGRAGRQGDPGMSQFYVSFEDELMRLFGDRAAKVFDKFKLEEGTSLEHPWASKSIERAQKKVEQNNFAIRKRQLEYDDVLNAQRQVIYDRRMHALRGERSHADFLDTLSAVVKELAGRFVREEPSPEEAREEVIRMLAFSPNIDHTLLRSSEKLIAEELLSQALSFYHAKRASLAAPFLEGMKRLAQLPENERPPRVRVDFTDGRRLLPAVTTIDTAIATEGMDLCDALERAATLAVIDERWTEHLRDLDEIKEGIGLRAFGQRDPLVEYKREAFEAFRTMIEKINREVASLVMRSGPLADAAARRPAAAPTRHMDVRRAQASQAQAPSALPPAPGQESAPAQQQDPSAPKKTVVIAKKHGRNDVVTIQNPATGATEQIKYKNAEARLRQGWILVD